MTREEREKAIKEFQQIVESAEWVDSSTADGVSVDLIKCAIEALQTQLKESQENFNKDSETESMLKADLISRQNCKYRHENGNCLAVGGFCLSVDDEHCQYEAGPCEDTISRQSYLSIDDVMSVFDDFMCGEVDEDGTETFLEMLKDKAEISPQKLIRCKDCKYYVPWDYDHYSYCAKSHLQHPVENCFCSYAEAKMEEGE